MFRQLEMIVIVAPDWTLTILPEGKNRRNYTEIYNSGSQQAPGCHDRTAETSWYWNEDGGAQGPQIKNFEITW